MLEQQTAPIAEQQEQPTEEEEGDDFVSIDKLETLGINRGLVRRECGHRASTGCASWPQHPPPTQVTSKRPRMPATTLANRS